jgi:hypothetical protein
VLSEALEPEPILAALKADHYYLSQGPEIHRVEVGEGAGKVVDAADRRAWTNLLWLDRG